MNVAAGMHAAVLRAEQCVSLPDAPLFDRRAVSRGGRMAEIFKFLVALIFLLRLQAVAQQAGTPEYNSVYLPAHGVGDTRTSKPQKWGSLGIGYWWGFHLDIYCG